MSRPRPSEESVHQEGLLSLAKAPKWLEELSNNVRNARPSSWKLGLGVGPNASSPNLETHSATKSKNDVNYELNVNGRSRPASMMENLTLDLRRLSCGEEDMCAIRDGSAKYGRRAVSDTYTRSVGNSPRTTSFGIEEAFTFNTLSPLKEKTRPKLLDGNIDREMTRSTNSKITSQSAVTRPRIFQNEPEEKDKCLEESWNSLNVFNVKQKGRLSRENDEKGTLFTTAQRTSKKVSVEQKVCDETEVPSDKDMLASSQRPASDFIIPELPRGIQLNINIHTTWGDRHYLGLNGIELFSHTGEPVLIEKIWAKPSDINELPEYGKDPRIITNLLDGVNRTHDDMHLWLAPFTENLDHFIHIRFKEEIQLAMVRIWNYNKSRIHSYRGVKDVDITLDGIPIFRGEIARACGGLLGGMEAFGDTILFTTDDNILELISQYDENFNKFLTDVNQEMEKFQVERPATGYRGDERPFTGTVNAGPSWSPAQDEGYDTVLGGQQLQLSLLANWGHPFCIGLTGFEVFKESGCAIPIEPQYLSCNSRSPDIYRLIDGNNVTTEESHMWQTDFSPGQPIVLTVNFPSTVYVAGIRLWNYNSSSDMSYCGVKLLTISLDSRMAAPNPSGMFTIRRAPGNCHFNFVQELPLHHSSYLPYMDSMPLRETYIGEPSETAHSSKTSDPGPLGDASCLPGLDDQRRGSMRDMEYEAPVVMPQGFVFQILILSTWGDSYYVGLNGLELFDHEGERIRLTENNIEAFPESVNVLEGVSDDVRTPDKLIDGINETTDGRHMWLAPILPEQLNRIYVIFDYPVTVSMIKLWNYSKTSSRGIKEFGILVDDLLVYNGVLDRFANNPREVAYRTVLFTVDEKVLQRERSTEVRDSSYGKDVEFLNNHRRVTSGGNHLSADQSKRPHTSIHSKASRSKSLYDL